MNGLVKLELLPDKFLRASIEARLASRAAPRAIKALAQQCECQGKEGEQNQSPKAEGRRNAQQITLFDSVGFAVEDFSALRYVRDQLARTGQFMELDLLADPDEPRDLFGMLLRAGHKSAA